MLTIGFARRVATYKRATLLFNDLERLARLVEDAGRPVLFVFAGKSHPADEPARKLLRDVNAISARPEFLGRVVFIEDYDMALARLLVAGVDVGSTTRSRRSKRAERPASRPRSTAR